MSQALSAIVVRCAVAILVVGILSCGDSTGPGPAPSVRIVTPVDSASVLAGDTVVFRAEASDSVDGPLTGASVTWTVDTLPVAGSGDSIRILLSVPGRHVVAAHATNSAGMTAVDRVPVDVRNDSPPVIASVSLWPGDSFYLSDSLRFAVTFSDADSAVPADHVRWTSDVDGDLGTGDTLWLAAGSLSAGAHHITVRVMDPEGQADSSTVTALAAAVPDRMIWTRRFPGQTPYGTLINLADDGSIIFGINPGVDGCKTCLYDINADGSERWHAAVTNQLWAHSSGLTTAPDGTIFAFDWQGKAYSWSSNGSVLWTAQVLGHDPHGRWALGTDGALYATGNSNDNTSAVLDRLSPTDGSISWSVTGPCCFHSAGVFLDSAGRAVADIGVTTGSGVRTAFTWITANGSVVQVDTSGLERWSDFNRGAMDFAGTMYLSTSLDSLVVIRADRSRPWSALFPSAPSEPVIDAAGIVYVAAGGTNGVRALNSANGSVVWQETVPGTTELSEPALTSDGGLLIAAGDTLFALATADGSVRWKVPLLRPFDSSIVIAPNGTIYGVTQEPRLVAIRGDAGIATDAPWATYRGNNRGTASVQK